MPSTSFATSYDSNTYNILRKWDFFQDGRIILHFDHQHVTIPAASHANQNLFSLTLFEFNHFEKSHLAINNHVLSDTDLGGVVVFNWEKAYMWLKH